MQQCLELLPDLDLGQQTRRLPRLCVKPLKPHPGQSIPRLMQVGATDEQLERQPPIGVRERSMQGQLWCAFAGKRS